MHLSRETAQQFTTHLHPIYDQCIPNLEVGSNDLYPCENQDPSEMEMSVFHGQIVFLLSNNVYRVTPIRILNNMSLYTPIYMRICKFVHVHVIVHVLTANRTLFYRLQMDSWIHHPISLPITMYYWMRLKTCIILLIQTDSNEKITTRQHYCMTLGMLKS